MSFDFDDLDEGLLPPELLGVQAMKDEDFAKFGERISKAEKIGKYEDFDIAIMEALWDENLAKGRVNLVITEFLALAIRTAQSKLAETWVQRSGQAIMYTLFQFSLSLSQHEIRTRCGRPGAPCVALILGFGGSHVDELEPQVEFYHSQGFPVISMAPCSSPAKLGEKQLAKLAQELRAALTGGVKLHLHLCSNTGFSRWIDVMASWTNQRVPFESLPPLQECLSSMVIECAPETPTHPVTGEVLAMPGSPVFANEQKAAKAPTTEEMASPPATTETGPSTAGGTTALSTAQMQEVQDMEANHFVMVMLGCIGALYLRWAPEANWNKLVYSEKKIMAFLRGAAKHGAFWRTEEAARKMAQEDVPTKNSSDVTNTDGLFGHFVHWEWMDLAIQPPTPRLFLYSMEDRLIVAQKVEAYVRHTQRYNPKALVSTHKCKASPHCKLWEMEPDSCMKAVSAFFKSNQLFSH